MGQVQVALGTVDSAFSQFAPIPVMSSKFLDIGEMTVTSTAATSAVKADDAHLNNNDPPKVIWRIEVDDTEDVYASFGTPPAAASASTGVRLGKGRTHYFSVTAAGEQVSLVSVS